MARLHNPDAASSQDQITLLRAFVGRMDQAQDRVAFCIVKQLLLERIAELESESTHAPPTNSNREPRLS
jgi:hypothetical protein